MKITYLRLSLIFLFGITNLEAAEVNENKFAALAIDRENGFYYGWAYDHPSRVKAEEIALIEAKNRGAKNPSVVLAWQGSGCGAYRTLSSNVGTSYGWGLAKSKEQADKIAIEQANLRSNGVQPENFVWACNSDSTKPLKPLYDATSEIIPSVNIYGQIWATQNLKVTKFRNGDPIHRAKTADEFKNSKNIPMYFCYEEKLCKIHGYLYNGYAVIDKRGLAPEGWKIPSLNDWVKLSNNLGGKELATTRLRSTKGWPSYAKKVTNPTGFNALPSNWFVGSYEYWKKQYTGLDYKGEPKVHNDIMYWSSTTEEYKGTTYIKHIILATYDSGDEFKYGGSQGLSNGLNIRLIKE